MRTGRTRSARIMAEGTARIMDARIMDAGGRGLTLPWARDMEAALPPLTYDSFFPYCA